jgi:formylglycine-generating enzyme required for sulfatase activity
MKKTYIIFSLILSSLAPTFAQVDQQGLISRLKNYEPDTYKQSVSNLIQQYPNDYKPIKRWEEAVNELTLHKADYIKALQANDSKAVKKATALLNKLDQNLLANPLLEEKKIVAIRRALGTKARTAMSGHLGIAPSNFQNNSEVWNAAKGWDNTFVTLTPSKKGVKQTTLFTPDSGKIIADPEPHFSGEKMLYASIGSSNRWHLFELDIKTGETKQVTPDTYKDFDSFDGCYLPDGRLVFCSTATFLGLPCTNGGNKMCGLYLFDPKTGKTRQLTYDQDSNWGPAVMENGMVLYQRWEYADLPHSNSRIMFTMNPDGTTQQAYYGSNSYFPASFFNARPIPGRPSAMVGIASGHHSVSRSGRLMIIDTKKGRREAEGVVAEIPHAGREVEPLERDRLPDGVWPQFLQPYPLNDTYFIVSMKATPTSLWGLYLVDTYNNMTLIAEEENMAYLEPVLMEQQKLPAIIPDRINLAETTSTVFIQDIYQGGGLKDIPRGTVKRLRIGSYSFSPLNQGGLLGTIGMDGPWDIKRILGEVEVEADGSAMFTIPANTPVFLLPLDEEGKALQVMRSWLTGMPGETLSCIGCHEDKNMIPVPRANIASTKAPQTIKEWHGKERGFSYRHEIQPILDRKCVSCHSQEKPDKPYLKGDKWITDWTSQIGGRAGSDYGGHFTQSYANLHRYVRRPGIESDMQMLVPMDVHADQTELMQLLNKNHYNVSLDAEEIARFACWIDFNAPFHGRRSDIANYPGTVKSNELRELYSDMLGTPKVDIEYLPELKENIEPIMPIQVKTVVEDIALAGWPLYDPIKSRYGAWGKAHGKQLALGNIHKKITLGDGVALELIKIPAGSFIMGSTRHPDEMPQTAVQIDKPYWIGQFEITNAQYRAFDPTHDSRDEHRHGYQFGRRGYSMNHDDQPAVRISWQQAMDYCAWLSKETGMQFTLPTESEWEWACRAGSDTPFWFGDLSSDFSRYANLGDIKLKEFAACTSYKFYESARVIDNPNKYDDWIPRDTLYNDGGFISEPVGRYVRNPWDLFDMHGNVWEWTRSAYQPYPYNAVDGRNDVSEAAPKRVARGGSWYDRPKRSTSSFRLPYRPYQKVYNVGFRVVMVEEGN